MYHRRVYISLSSGSLSTGQRFASMKWIFFPTTLQWTCSRDPWGPQPVVLLCNTAHVLHQKFNESIYIYICGLIIIIIIIYPFIARVVGASQMISQPVSSNLPCSPLPSGVWRTPGLSIPWCCLPTSSSDCLVFFPLSLCLAKWFWPDLMNGMTWPYHCSLRLFTMIRRSSCGPIACWVLGRTSSLVTWSL